MSTSRSENMSSQLQLHDKLDTIFDFQKKQKPLLFFFFVQVVGMEPLKHVECGHYLAIIIIIVSLRFY